MTTARGSIARPTPGSSACGSVLHPVAMSVLTSTALAAADVAPARLIAALQERGRNHTSRRSDKQVIRDIVLQATGLDFVSIRRRSRRILVDVLAEEMLYREHSRDHRVLILKSALPATILSSAAGLRADRLIAFGRFERFFGPMIIERSLASWEGATTLSIARDPHEPDGSR